MKQRQFKHMALILALSAAMLAGSSSTAFAQMDDTGDSGATIEESVSLAGTVTDQNGSASTSRETAGSEQGNASGNTGDHSVQGPVTEDASETSTDTAGVQDTGAEDTKTSLSDGETPQIQTAGSVGAAATANLKPSTNLTPSGNMDLVDDLEEEAAQDMQFLTVKSRDGSYFYIVIDRSGNTQNVYFLNEVDASDLMALMSDEEKERFAAEEVQEEEAEKDDLFSISTTEPNEGESGEDVSEDTNEVQGEIGTEEAEGTDPASEEPETNRQSQLPILIPIGILAALIIGGYYLLKIRPGRAGGYGDDLEFEDDEEYGQEEEFEQDEEEEDDPEDDLF